MGRAAESWERFVHVLHSGELEEILNLYAEDAVYLEPYNPPHNGNLLIQAYLKDYLAGKDDLAVDVKRLIENESGDAVAIEWTMSYQAAGRRWNNLPRASFVELGEDGTIAYHRDYT